jgi:hypothetical protein
MDAIEDSMVAETVAQCSYNTAYNALCEVKGTNKELEKAEGTLCCDAM